MNGSRIRARVARAMTILLACAGLLATPMTARADGLEGLERAAKDEGLVEYVHAEGADACSQTSYGIVTGTATVSECAAFVDKPVDHTFDVVWLTVTQPEADSLADSWRQKESDASQGVTRIGDTGWRISDGFAGWTCDMLVDGTMVLMIAYADPGMQAQAQALEQAAAPASDTSDAAGPDTQSATPSARGDPTATQDGTQSGADPAGSASASADASAQTDTAHRSDGTGRRLPVAVAVLILVCAAGLCLVRPRRHRTAGRSRGRGGRSKRVTAAATPLDGPAARADRGANTQPIPCRRPTVDEPARQEIPIRRHDGTEG